MRNFALRTVAALACSAAVLPVAAAEINLTDRMALSRHSASGKANITMLVATKEGQQDAFEAFLGKNNYPVRFKERKIGYYRIRIPTEAAMQVAAHPAIEAVALTGIGMPYMIFRPDMADGGQPNDAGQKTKSQLPQLDYQEYAASAAPDSPAMGLDEMGLIQLRKKSMSFDGRGVTVAFVEGFPDIGAPELATAKTLDGKPSAKIPASYAITSFDPDEENDRGRSADRLFMKFSTPVMAQGNHLVAGDRRLTVPQPGSYQVAWLDESRFGEIARDFNKDGNPENKPRAFAVVRQVGKSCVRIDLDQNDDLRNDPCIADFNSSRRSYRFIAPTGEETGPRFIVVNTDNPDIIAIGIPNIHTHQSILTIGADKIYGSALTGAAPGASIVPIQPDLTLPEALIESYIRAANDPRVDIISGGPSHPGNYETNHTLWAVTLNRIATKFNKVIVMSAGNDSGLVNSVMVGPSAANVLAVGQYHAAATKGLLTGLVGRRDSISSASSAGPSEDGLLKPDILASSLAALPTTDSFDFDKDEHEGMARACPNVKPAPKLTCFGGTSMAGPMAAGAVAVLISAAKQQGIPYTAEDIISAVRFSARQLPGTPAFHQGNGVINVPAALEWLVDNAKSAAPRLVVSAPVNTALSQEFPEPNTGFGLYEREGWFVGDSGKRDITIRRTSGPSKALTYRLTLEGNDGGTFEIASTAILLPLNVDVIVPVELRPRSNGVHSAKLAIAQASDNRIIKTVGLTIVAATPLNETNQYRAKLSAISSETDTARYYIYVPPGTVALKTRYDTGDRKARPFLRGPAGQSNYAHFDKINTDRPFIIPNVTEKTQDRQSIYRPAPGVWEILLHNDKPLKGDVQFSAEFEAVPEAAIKPVSAVAGPSLAGQNSILPTSTTANNRFVSGMQLKGRLTFASQDAPKIVTFDMPPDVIRLDGSVRTSRTTSDPASLVNIMALDCTEEPCRPKGFETGPGQTGIIVTRTRPGKWKVAIDVSRKAGEQVTADYEIFITTAQHSSTMERPPSNTQFKTVGIASEDSKASLTVVTGCFMELVDDEYQELEYGVAHHSIDSPVITTIVRQENIPLMRANVVQVGSEQVSGQINLSSSDIKSIGPRGCGG